ncbi:MAG: DUF177 domain-containing protein [Paracoccus denitrificans]|uniref:DUF177 domain-containing protein n=1 Tax=Paracoccus denitrificans TaxID=266 RepID=A0A533IDD0_PARDE|nr:MAG: DUF177 domain-containing protein [Paracoccus denitrificans]
MSAGNPIPQRLRVAHLSPSRPNEFDIQPDTAARARIAAELDLLDLPEFRFTGAIRASGADEWALSGKLSAHVVQPCAITLEPVASKLSEEVALLFSPHVATPTEEEVEMGDESIEPLGQWIELGDIALEALSLALPSHPVAPGAVLPDEAVDDTELEPDDKRKPFAGLADLMKRDDG